MACEQAPGEMVDRAWPILEPAIERGDGITPWEMFHALRAGEAWLFFGGRSAVYCVRDNGALRIALAGGDLQECLAVYRKQIRPFAVENGFERIEIIGRKGWGRTLKEFKEVARLYRCELCPS